MGQRIRNILFEVFGWGIIVFIVFLISYAVIGTIVMVVAGFIEQSAHAVEETAQPVIQTETQYESFVQRVEVPVEVPVEKIVEVPIEVPVVEYVEVPVVQTITEKVVVDDGEAYRIALTTPCVQEDSDYCYWNAATMGNGTGNSFVVVNGTRYYL